jgi:sugar phosphate isomerase/epimerase
MSRISDRIALNTIPWATAKEHPGDPDVWRFADPRFREMYPGILRQVRESGFTSVMMEVLSTQTLQSYERMVGEAGLTLAPGYAEIGIPDEDGIAFARGGAEWVHWFDGIRRKAEESNYFGLKTIFLGPRISWRPGSRAAVAAAVGYDFDAHKLERVTEFFAEAVDVLAKEGITAGLHNHVGTPIETESEIDYVLTAIPDLRASFDVGHLAWAGIDPGAMLTRYADRLGDLHVKDLDLSIAADSRINPTGYSKTTARRFFLEPGRGDLDLDQIVRSLPDTFEGWIIVEVDRTTLTPFESARLSAQWAHTFAAE